MIDPLRPTNPPARRAGVAFLVFGGVGLLLAAIFLLAGANLPALSQDPAFKHEIDKLTAQLQFDARIVLLVFGGLLGIYAIIALIAGYFVRGGSRAAVISGIVLTALVILWIGLNAAVALAHGEIAGAVVPLVLIAVHLWLLKTLIEAFRCVATSTVSFVSPTLYRPMQAYYQPPVQPSSL